MPVGRERDVALREVSRNLRHVDRDHAIEAAAAMSEDSELRTFRPGRDRLYDTVAEAEPSREGRACERSIERLRPGKADAAVDRQIRDCFSMDAPPGIVPPPIPPFRLILVAADALPPGSTKAQLLYMATWDGVPERPAGGAADAVRRLRVLLPLLDGDTRREATEWLETTSVDLIEGRPDNAVARVRRSLARMSQSDAELLLSGPRMQAWTLVVDLLRIGDVEHAMRATELLPVSETCSTPDIGTGDVISHAVRLADRTTLIAYMGRLRGTGLLSRLCPKGLDDDLAVDVWFAVGDEQKALEVATQAGKPLLLARTRLAVAERRRGAGDVQGARAMLREAAAVSAPAVADQGERGAAARQRMEMIHPLAGLGDVSEAERLAAGYPGPGWRGLAYSVIVATTNREKIPPNWVGPVVDLSEVPPDH